MNALSYKISEWNFWQMSAERLFGGETEVPCMGFYPRLSRCMALCQIALKQDIEFSTAPWLSTATNSQQCMGFNTKDKLQDKTKKK